jgi:hypothetical protein
MLSSIAVIIVRSLLGLLFLTASIDGFAYLIRGKELFAPPLSEAGKDFLHELKERRAIWFMKASVDLIAALMLLFNFHAPLGLLLILPSSAIIIVFQFSVNKVGIPVAIMLSVLLLAVGIHYISLYAPLLTNLADGMGPVGSGAYGHPHGS